MNSVLNLLMLMQISSGGPPLCLKMQATAGARSAVTVPCAASSQVWALKSGELSTTDEAGSRWCDLLLISDCVSTVLEVCFDWTLVWFGVQVPHCAEHLNRQHYNLSRRP